MKSLSSVRIDYDQSRNVHSVNGPRAVFLNLFEGYLPSSILDVGCGTGTWLRAALEAGVTDVIGIDGRDIPVNELLLPPECFFTKDLTVPFDLARRFDLVICLEVAEHLDEEYADTLLGTLARHSDCIIFSAAAPGQPGQHHVNCQVPLWWQQRFNELGFCCDDQVRWRVWDETRLEPWYRQNMFLARKDPHRASREPRLKAVLHPHMLPHLLSAASTTAAIANIESGSMPTHWYFGSAVKALATKAQRKLARGDKQKWR